MPSPISIGSTALLAGLVCLTAGCASLDTRMKRFVGKPIDAVIKSYGVEPTEGRVKSGNNRYAYLWRYTYYSYGGREYEGSSQNGPIITNYYSDVCYLVTAEIGGTDTLKELRMLFAAHGIGFIKLDVDNPADSQVLIPARERDEIDWDMANRLATENRDFLEYVKLVKQFYQTGEARPADWDVPKLDD